MADLERLTDRQRICLRMVYRHMSSKDIARELKISPHTVDQRLRFAIRHLGVSTRIEAARVLAAHEGVVYNLHGSNGLSQAGLGDGAPLNVARRGLAVQYDDTFRTSDDGVPSEDAGAIHTSALADRPAPLRTSRWPFRTKDAARNDLDISSRLAWIFGIGIGGALAFGMVLAGMDALSRLLSGR